MTEFSSLPTRTLYDFSSMKSYSASVVPRAAYSRSLSLLTAIMLSSM